MLANSTVSALFDATGVAICGFDSEQRTTFWNETFLAFFPEHAGKIHVGESYADNLRRFYSLRLDASELADIERMVTEGIERHKQQQQPFSFRHHNRRLQVSSLPMPDGSGRIRVWRALADDAEKLHRHDAIPTYDVLKHIPDGACIIDGQQRLLACNDAFRSLYGLPAAVPIVGLTLDEIVAACWRGCVDGRLDAYFAAQQPSL